MYKPNYVVINGFESTNPDPISFGKGALVRVIAKYTADPEWTNWVLCENAEGKRGYTPTQYLRMSDDDWATTLADYSAHELTIAADERLFVDQILNGWARARTSQGEWGWIPMRNIEKLEITTGNIQN